VAGFPRNGPTSAAASALLARIPIFEGLPADAVELLAAASTFRRFRAGQQVFFQGDVADAMYVVASGRLKVAVSSVRGDELVLEVLTVGDAVGELGALDGVRFLLPRADIGRELLGDELRDAGAEVLEVVAYRTVIGGAEREEAEIYRMLLDRQIDAITFTSASTVRNFVSILGPDQAADLLRTTVVACIGPVTAEAAQQLDIATTVMPERYTIPDLVDALVEHFGKK